MTGFRSGWSGSLTKRARTAGRATGKRREQGSPANGPPVCWPSGGGVGPITWSGRRRDDGGLILVLLHLVLKGGVDPGDTEAAVGAMQEAAHAAIFLLKPAGIVTVRITEGAAVKIQGLLSFMADEARRSCHGSPLLCVLRPAAKARKHEFVPYGLLQSLHGV